MTACLTKILSVIFFDEKTNSDCGNCDETNNIDLVVKNSRTSKLVIQMNLKCGE